MAYGNLHTHTQYSNIGSNSLDSINKLEDLVLRAKELGLTGLAITEHDCLSGTMRVNNYQKYLRDRGEAFKLAIGNEIYLIDDFPEENTRQKYYHFILIAKDEVGFKALKELSSKAWYRSKVRYNKRRVPTLKANVEEVMKWAKGHLIAASACLGGEYATSIINKEYEQASNFLDWCYRIFDEDFFIEMQPSSNKVQIEFNNWVITNFPADKCIITTDAHYLSKEDFPIQEAFLRSQQENREVKEYYEYAHLMSEKEVLELMKLTKASQDYVRICLNNTNKILDCIQFYDLQQQEVIPKVDVQEIELELDEEQLKDLNNYKFLLAAINDSSLNARYCGRYCLNSLMERNKWNSTYLDRLNEEFDVFYYQTERLKSDFFSYFNGIQHFINVAWSVDCAVGPSRGSAGGCLTCYLLGITQEDPIQYGLYFWRFINKSRIELPDIDVDFAPSKKEKLFEAIRKERGELGLSQVATFKTLTLKAAIGNAARGYRSQDFPDGLDPDISRYLSSLIQSYRGAIATLQQTLDGDEEKGFTKNYAFIKECNAYPGLLDIIKKFEGLIVNSSTHASAVVLFDKEDTLLKHCSLMRSPNGDLCTAYELHDSSSAGMVKYDFLLLSTLDIMSSCFDLLKEENKIDRKLSLKECYSTYIDVNKIDYNDAKIWKHLYDNDVLSIFQWDAISGRKGILAAKPENLEELTILNGLIRLVTPDGEESQLDRFIRIKNQPFLFEIEMKKAGCSEEQRRMMHEELDRYNGCAVTQESFMLLSQKLAGYSFKEANALRKVVAKKKVNEIEGQRELFFSKCPGSDTTKQYLWNTVIKPSLGYSFSLNHALPYSMVGVQCIELGGILFPPIFWQTACLLQRSGALDNKSPDYNKIAKAVTSVGNQGCNIQPVNINKSANEFKLDLNTNTIYYGFAGVKGIRTKAIEEILNNRPFNSFKDFIERTNCDITSIVTLIKAGAFNNFNSKQNLIKEIAYYKSDTKNRLTAQNYSMLNRIGLFPNENPELEFGRKIFIFTQYLKAITPKGTDYYNIDDEDACRFLNEINYKNDGNSLSKVDWKAYYDNALMPVKNYLIEHQNDLLMKANARISEEWENKYFPCNETESMWEILTMGLCFGDHPMSNVDNLIDFEDLPDEPEVQYFFTTKKGRQVPIYQLDMIAGYAIAKDKLHSTITILTTTGPVDVKFRKEEFAHYDAQISQKNSDGKKEVVERSWFNRGNALLVHGLRQDGIFIAKTYKNSPMKHTCYKITDLINEGTKFEVQKERKKGKEEEEEPIDES